MALGEFFRRPAFEWDNPDRFIRHLRKATRVRDRLPDLLQVSAAHVNDGAAVGGPPDHSQVLTVVFFIRGQPPSFIVGRCGHPQVSCAALIQQPDHAPTTRGRVQFRSERRAEILLDRRAAGDQRKHKQESHAAILSHPGG